MRSLSSLSLLLVCAALVAGCATNHPPRSGAEPAPAHRGGAYYQDDGPGDNPPANLDQLADAVPRADPYMSGPNRAYSVFGKEYVPDISDRPLVEHGIGSWYGRKFNGQRTSSGEIYDMYAMTAAHPTLPIPSYARVTNLANGRSVIVRVNDRGPFHSGRIIDLSYAAAYKLGYVNQGSSNVEVERLLPRDILAGRFNGPAPVASSPPESSRPVVPPPGAVAPAPPAVVMPLAVIASAAPDVPSGVRAPGAIDPDVPADLIPADALPPSGGLRASPGGGHYLQLGAFRQRTGAEDFMHHMSGELDPTLSTRLHVVAGDSLYRVQIGPYGERSDAETAAQRLRDDLGYTVLVLSPR